MGVGGVWRGCGESGRWWLGMGGGWGETVVVVGEVVVVGSMYFICMYV